MFVTRLTEAASLLTTNRLAPGPFEGLPESVRPQDELQGYAIQSVLADRLREEGFGAVAGVKIGCTTSVMQDYMKIGSPCAGTIHRSGVCDTPATLRFADYHRVGVECEIAVRLSSTLPDPGAPAERADIAVCVGACMAAIEIVDDRYRDFRALDTPTLIADDFFHAGCVLGPPVTDWDALDLGAASGQMAINGTVVGNGRGADILGHPFNALSWLAETGQARARGLGAGSIVMLGSVVQTVWVSAGDAVSIEIEGLGRAAVRFA